MICVAGFNTAVDRFATAETFEAGRVNRLSSIRVYPGGKGVHVAQAAALLGARVSLVGIIDRTQRAWFDRILAARGVDFRGVEIGEAIRACVAVRDRGGVITELLEPGPTLRDEEAARLESDFLTATRDARVVVMTGSLPDGVAGDLYGRLIAKLKTRVPHVIVDTSGRALREALRSGPTMVKPNRDEASGLVGRPVSDEATAIEAARAIAQTGVPRVVVSLGSEGAVTVWDGRTGRVRIDGEPPVSAVGSGDCFVGGIAVALERGDPPEHVLRLGAACGAANTRSDEPGHFDPGDLQRLLSRVRISWQ